MRPSIDFVKSEFKRRGWEYNVPNEPTQRMIDMGITTDELLWWRLQKALKIELDKEQFGFPEQYNGSHPCLYDIQRCRCVREEADYKPLLPNAPPGEIRDMVKEINYRYK